MGSYSQYKEKAIALRREGRTYTEIQEILEINIPPSTLSTWFKNLKFSKREKMLLEICARNRIRNAHLKTLAIKKIKRKQYFQEIEDRLIILNEKLADPEVAKLALMMLYWCEGGKRDNGCVQFGNSDPDMIRLFMKLIRYCYPVDEKKFRCTVQCRADQNVQALIRYWSSVTNIPPEQFYKSQIDPRTIGKPSKNLEYKGVCKIDYFSSKVFHELLSANKIFKGP